MLVIENIEYKELFKDTKQLMHSKENIIDVYHKNNWDHFHIHCDDEKKQYEPSYIDFFFDAKSMVLFITQFLKDTNFEFCYITPIYNDKYKLKLFDDDICKDVYNEFKTMINSLGLKVSTKDTIQMTKHEFIDLCGLFSVGGFCGVSNYSILIPELNIIIVPHHHMNYLIYTDEKEKMIGKLNDTNLQEILIL